MSTSVRLSAPADPGPNEHPRKAIHWRRGKKATFFPGGVEASLRPPFPLGCGGIFSFTKEPGAGGEWRSRTLFIAKAAARWVDLGSG